MIIHKSHSKTDLIDLINDLDIDITHSHQDNKKMIQDKIKSYLINHKCSQLDDNFYNLKNIDGLNQYLVHKNPKKVLSIKEKNNVMLIAKHIIAYCKDNYNLNNSKYDTIKELQDDMDFIKQFGDIPSVRRCCKLMNIDVKFPKKTFVPYLSPQVQKELNDKYGKINPVQPILTIRRSTPDNPVIVYFD